MPLTAPASTDADALVSGHLALVEHVVNEYAFKVPRHVDRDELRSAAMLGLAQAASAFDPAAGVPFGHYARSRMRGAILDELRGRDWAPRSVRADAKRLSAVRERLAAQGIVESTEAVAAEAGWTADKVAAVVADTHRATVLNYDGMRSDEGSMAEFIPSSAAGPVARLLDAERLGYLHDAVAALPDRIRAAVVGYFFDERPMADLAEELGVSESRISQIVSEGLGLIRTALDRIDEADGGSPADAPTGRRERRIAAYAATVASASTVRARLEVGTTVAA